MRGVSVWAQKIGAQMCADSRIPFQFGKFVRKLFLSRAFFAAASFLCGSGFLSAGLCRASFLCACLFCGSFYGCLFRRSFLGGSFFCRRFFCYCFCHIFSCFVIVGKPPFPAGLLKWLSIFSDIPRVEVLPNGRQRPRVSVLDTRCVEIVISDVIFPVGYQNMQNRLRLYKIFDSPPIVLLSYFCTFFEALATNFFTVA